MPGFWRELRLKGEAKEIFMAKQTTIHQAVLEVRVRQMKEEAEAGAKRKPGEVTLTGSENG